MTNLNRDWPRLLTLLSMAFLGMCTLGQNGPKLRVPLEYQTPTHAIGAYIDTANHPTSYVVWAQNLVAEGGAPLRNYDWSVANLSSLPAGMTVDPQTGVVKGTGGILLEGQHQFTMEVSDGSSTAQGDFVLSVEVIANAPYPVMVFQGTGENQDVEYPLDDGYANKPYGASLPVFGGYPPYTWSEDDSYSGRNAFDASGLAIDGNSGTVYGTLMESASGESLKFRAVVKESKGSTCNWPVYTIYVH